MDWQLRQGSWQTALEGVECDTLLCDPPYSERTHGGYDKGASDWERLGQDARIAYSALTPEQVDEFLTSWLPRTKNWVVIFGDDVTQRWWQDGLRQRKDWLCFAPVVWLKRFASPRLSGDGPTSSAEWITVARRRGIERTGSLPGFYEVRQVGERIGVVGSKNLLGMRALVRDYSGPRDLICDPFAGGGTTLLAAMLEGRKSIGAEQDPETFAKAKRRLETTPVPVRPLFYDVESSQGDLLRDK